MAFCNHSYGNQPGRQVHLDSASPLTSIAKVIEPTTKRPSRRSFQSRLLVFAQSLWILFTIFPSFPVSLESRL